MKYIDSHILFYVLIFTMHGFSVIGYPMMNMAENLMNKAEKQYPNGTVIGKYTYTDKDGNPIDVKYFADDSSYGVEVKSVKIVNSDLVPAETMTKYPLQKIEHPFESSLDPLTSFKDSINKNSTHDSFQIFKDKAKGDLKNNGEFEILLENEVKAPEKCGKEKVKVYFDKDKRKTRNTPDRYRSINYCNRV